MIKKILYFQVLGLSTMLAACSGTGNRLTGKQCPKRFDPVPMNVPAQSKLDVASVTIPDGEYGLISSQLYFKGDATEIAPDGFQVLLKQEVSRNTTKVKNKETHREMDLTTGADCFRNAKVTQEHGLNVPGVSGITVANGVVQSTDVKTFGFTMSADGQFDLLKESIEQKFTTPQRVLRDADETFVVKHSPTDYEFRTKGRGTNGSYYLSTFLRLVK